MKSMRIALMIGAWLGAAGCNARASELRSLDGRNFIDESVDGKTLVPHTEIRIGFQDHQLQANAGCNHMSGDYEIDDGVLFIDGLGSTAIGCNTDLSAQDSWIAELLTGRPKLMFDDPHLTLTGKGVTLVLIDREVGSPDRSLVGTHWIGNGAGSGGAVGFGPGSERVTLDFEESTFVAFTGCRGATGNYEADATTLRISGLALASDHSCDSQQLSLEASVQAVLGGPVVEYEIEERNLTLTRGDFLLLFRAGE